MNEGPDLVFFDICQLKRFITVRNVKRRKAKAPVSNGKPANPVAEPKEAQKPPRKNGVGGILSTMSPFGNQFDTESLNSPVVPDAGLFESSSSPPTSERTTKGNRLPTFVMQEPNFEEEEVDASLLKSEFEGYTVESMLSDAKQRDGSDSEYDVADGDNDEAENTDNSSIRSFRRGASPDPKRTKQPKQIAIQDVIAGGDAENTVLVVRYSNNDLLLYWQDADLETTEKENNGDAPIPIDDERHKSTGCARTLSWFREKSIDIRGGMDLSPDAKYLMCSTLNAQLYIVPLHKHLTPLKQVVTFGDPVSFSPLSRAIAAFGITPKTGDASNVSRNVVSADKNSALFKISDRPLSISASEPKLKPSLYEMTMNVGLDGSHTIADPFSIEGHVVPIAFSCTFPFSSFIDQSSAIDRSNPDSILFNYRRGLISIEELSGERPVPPQRGDGGSVAASAASSSVHSFSGVLLGVLPYVSSQNHVTAVVWWTSLISGEHYAIIGSSLGCLCIVDLSKKKEVFSLSADAFGSSIMKMEVLSFPSAFESYVLVRCVNGRYFQLYLEMPDPGVPPVLTVTGPKHTKFLRVFDPLQGKKVNLFKPSLLSKFSASNHCSVEAIRSFRSAEKSSSTSNSLVSQSPMIAAHDRLQGRCEIFDARSLNEEYPLFVFHVPSDADFVLPTSQLIFGLCRGSQLDSRVGERICLFSSISCASLSSSSSSFVHSHSDMNGPSSPSATGGQRNEDESPIVTRSIGSLGKRMEHAILQELRLPAKEICLGFVQHPVFNDLFYIFTQSSVFTISLRESPSSVFCQLLQGGTVSFSVAERLAKSFNLDVLQLYETSADAAYSQKEYRLAVALYKLSGAPIDKIVSKLVASYLSDGEPRTSVILGLLKDCVKKLDSLTLSNQRSVSDLMFQVLLHRAVEFREVDGLQAFVRDNMFYNAGSAIFSLVTSGFPLLAFHAAHYRKNSANLSLMESVFNLLINRDMYFVMEDEAIANFLVFHNYGSMLAAPANSVLLYLTRKPHLRALLIASSRETMSSFGPLLADDLPCLSMLHLRQLLPSLAPSSNFYFVALIILYSKYRSDPSADEERNELFSSFSRYIRVHQKVVDFDIVFRYSVRYQEWQLAQELLKVNGRMSESLALRISRCRAYFQDSSVSEVSTVTEFSLMVYSILEDLFAALNDSKMGVTDRQAAFLMHDVFVMILPFAQLSERLVSYVEERMSIFSKALLHFLRVPAMNVQFPHVDLLLLALENYAEERRESQTAVANSSEILVRHISENILKKMRKREFIRVGLSSLREKGVNYRVFSCGHQFVEHTFLDIILPTFKDRCGLFGLLKSCPLTVQAVMQELERSPSAVACPECVFNHLFKKLCDRDSSKRFEKWTISNV
eukprot:ANDGO_02040.mRNA.1 regulator of chromosome condensation (RCC1) repeat domain containing protein